ncbi:Golgi integral membrane protein 4 [Frankliniella occidentalis]|uniref:Golgi integral membrane protein 4 n=1 Tax=Frankliniella occidentalis TaxID=133901 RepID=A0A6J1SUS7_FRAOC|nr:Golgi integral membrane protein 4 [Frankliniella occidentalis]
MMTSSRIVRGTKGRLFACLGVLTLFAGVIFLYHSTRVELDEVSNSLSKCRQEQDSLAAQVQVISEYKKNLEKSLNQEKAEHRQTKEELQSQMNDEQQVRNKENLENINKYKALQQQYKLLQSEHDDLNEFYNKARAEQASCAEALSHMELQISTIQKDQTAKEAEVSNLKLKYLRLEEENKTLFQKLQSHLEQGPEEKGKASSNTIKLSSTKHADAADTAGGGDTDTGNLASLHEPPHNVLPVAQKRSTAAQDEMLQPARPAQPGLSVVSKPSGKQSTTPQVNPDALQSQDKARAIPALAVPLMLAPFQQHASVEKHDFANNGPQGVLPAPIGFGSDNQYAQQNAVPLQAPYRLIGLGHQEVPQNQGQMPPLAAVAAAVQNNVLPAPPGHVHNLAQHLPKFNQVIQQNMNPFRNDFVALPDSKLSHLEHNFVHNDNVYNSNGARAQEAYNLHKNADLSFDDKKYAAQDVNKHLFVGQNHQFERAGIMPPYLKSAIKNVKIVPLDGDINQHPDLEVQGRNPFVELGNHNQEIVHGKHHGLAAGQQEGHPVGHYNYQGGDYDKEDPPANNENEDEDLDQIDYNNEPNQAHQPHQIHPGHPIPKMVHRRLADRHQEDVMMHPR